MTNKKSHYTITYDDFNAYKEEKMAIALKLINYYRDQVDERVLVSLANVNFSIED